MFDFGFKKVKERNSDCLCTKQSPNFMVIHKPKKITMITPDNQIPLDDSENSDSEDQQSQQDIHSNGFDDAPEPGDTVDYADTDKLTQAYDASEAAYTLNLGDDGDNDTSDDE